MKTIIKKTSVDNIDMDTINQAGEIIRQGGLVAFLQKLFTDWEQMH